MKPVSGLLISLLLNSWLDCARAATPEPAFAALPTQPSPAIQSRDPSLTVHIATVQAGHAHYAGGNPGLEANFHVLAVQARAAANEQPDLIVFPEYRKVHANLGEQTWWGWSQGTEFRPIEFRGVRYDANDPAGLQTPLVTFAAPWTSPFHVDADFPHHLVNREGEHLLLLNKTAWAYFGCQDPGGYLDRARAQGMNVIRVALEGRPYWKDLGIELWPWAASLAKVSPTSC